MPSPETLDILFLMGGAGGLVLIGAVITRLMHKPHYTPTDKIQVQQGLGNRIGRIEAPNPGPGDSKDD